MILKSDGQVVSLGKYELQHVAPSGQSMLSLGVACLGSRIQNELGGARQDADRDRRHTASTLERVTRNLSSNRHGIQFELPKTLGNTPRNYLEHTSKHYELLSTSQCTQNSP